MRAWSSEGEGEMGDSADYWRDDGYKRRQEAKMVDCSGCQRKVFPESPCNWCGEDNTWQIRKPTPTAPATEES